MKKYTISIVLFVLAICCAIANTIYGGIDENGMEFGFFRIPLTWLFLIAAIIVGVYTYFRSKNK